MDARKTLEHTRRFVLTCMANQRAKRRLPIFTVSCSFDGRCEKRGLMVRQSLNLAGCSLLETVLNLQLEKKVKSHRDLPSCLRQRSAII